MKKFGRTIRVTLYTVVTVEYAIRIFLPWNWRELSECGMLSASEITFSLSFRLIFKLSIVMILLTGIFLFTLKVVPIKEADKKSKRAILSNWKLWASQPILDP